MYGLYAYIEVYKYAYNGVNIDIVNMIIINLSLVNYNYHPSLLNLEVFACQLTMTHQKWPNQ